MSRFAALCAILLVLSGLSLVSAQYRARQLFIDLDRARGQARKLEVEWATLQLDQTNYSKHSLIESAATRDLGMHRPLPGQTKYLQLPAHSATQRELESAPRPGATKGSR